MLTDTLTEYLAILDSVLFPVSVCDMNCNFLTMNKAYEKLFKVRREDYIGKNAMSRNDPEEQSFHARVIQYRREFQGVKTLASTTHNKYRIWAECCPLVLHGEMVGSVVSLIDYASVKNLIVNMDKADEIISHSVSSSARYSFRDILTRSPAMEELKDTVQSVSASSVTVLLRGESGTGKELFAHAIHRAGSRSDKPFLRINCASISESLLESILFGYTGNAFTGAKKSGQAGLFESADHGTVFLDEIGDITPALQVKLLRVLQEHEIVRVGDVTPIPVDIRVIAATNADLETKVREGSFRQDLYFRLNIFPVFIPPLRQRKEDILLLAAKFLEKAAHDNGREITGFSPEAAAALTGYPWPGNVRQLENVITRSVLVCHGSLILPEHLLLENLTDIVTAETDAEAAAAPAAPVPQPALPAETPVSYDPSLSYADLFARWEAGVIQAAYEANDCNKTRAAHALGISVRSYFAKAKKHNIH